MADRKGLFITFEGPEGSGKSTQARLTENYLESMGYEVDLTREPGSTALGEKIREILQHDRSIKLYARAELLLFMAARVQHVEERIRPFVEKGGIVICDRFTHSSEAYQGFGRGLDWETIRYLNAYSINGMRPDLTILLDVPVEVGLERLHSRLETTGAGVDKIEAEERAFHERVRKGYLAIAEAEKDTFEVIDAKSSLEVVQWDIRKALRERLGL